jgi:hypothetical protein
MSPKKPADQQAAPRATQPPEERGTRIIDLINPNEAARWLTLADAALGRGASAQEVAETEVLARKEQDAIKRRIRRRSEQVNRQSKSEQ